MKITKISQYPEIKSYDSEPFRVKDLPLNNIIVEHCIFCGKDLGIIIYVNPNNLTKLLPKR